MSVRKTLLILIACFVAVSAFAAAEAVITGASGRVELRYPGGDWEPAAVGMPLSRGTYISTGFNADATVLMGRSVLNVRQLTRLRLDELLEREGTQKTELFLRVGKVRAEIKTAAGLKHDFVMRSPISTAAVRGTVFTFDTVELDTVRGLVVLTNPRGMTTLVAPGERGRSSGKGLENAAQNKEKNTKVNFRTGGVKRGVGRLFDWVDRDLAGSIKIIWHKPEVE